MRQKFNIRPNTSVSQIRRGLGRSERERKRESDKRRRRLEKLARWVSGRNVKTFFQSTGAKCQQAPTSARYDLGIYIPTAEHEQPATNLEPSVWDFVFQKAELVHELGHVLYTDFEAMEDYVDRISDIHQKSLFKNLFNIVEDGAIERQLAADFNVGNDLEIKNANLLRIHEPGKQKGLVGDKRELAFHSAVETILMDWAKYDTGRAGRLLDPADLQYQFESQDERERVLDLLPTLRQMVADVVSEPNGRERVRITYEYFEELKEHFEDTGDILDDDLLQQVQKAFPDDANVHFVVPGEPPEDADELEVDEDDEVVFLDPGDYDDEAAEEGPGDGDEAEEEAEVDSEAEQGAGTAEEGDGDGERTEIEREVSAQYGTQIEADEEEDDLEADAVKWKRSVETTGHTLSVPDRGEADTDVWNRGMKYGKRYKKELQKALQAERESKRQSGQRAGRPDPQAMWQLGYGNTRVFTNEREPEDKDYNVVLLLDRSGSMGGDAMAEWIVDEAEATCIGLAWALEELGADVAIISLGGDVSLEKPFGASVESYKSVLARGHSRGGTPLGRALELAVDRLEGRQGESLVFSITDGWPSDEDRYLDALERLTFPVVGVYFGPDVPDLDDVREFYHRIAATDKEGLSNEVRSLIKRMVV